MLIWLYRILAICFALLAGMALGSSKTSWEGDIEGVRDEGWLPRLWSIGPGWARLRFFGARPGAGYGSTAIWAILAIVLMLLGWPELLAGSRMQGDTSWFMALFNPATWLMLGSLILGYVVSIVQAEKDSTPRY